MATNGCGGLPGYDDWKLRAPEDEPGFYAGDEPDHYCDECECAECNACLRCGQHLPACSRAKPPAPPPPAPVAVDGDIPF